MIHYTFDDVNHIVIVREQSLTHIKAPMLGLEGWFKVSSLPAVAN